MNTLSATAKPRQKRERKRIFIAIKALILLAPLPFGCVGEPWRPLFFALVAGIAYFAWKQVENEEPKANLLPGRTDPARDLLYGRSLPAKDRKRGAMAWAARLWRGFFFFCLFQLLPLPAAFVKLISPRTIEVVSRFRGVTPGWLTLSLVPRETLVFALEFMVLAVFSLALVRMRPGRREMTSLVRALAWSAALQVIIGLVRMLTGSRMFFLLFKPYERTGAELTGTLVNSNHFAFFLEMVAPLLLALVAVEFAGRGRHLFHNLMGTLENRPRVMADLFVLVLMATGVVLSNSRAGITALGVGLLTAGLMMVRTRKTGLQGILPVLVVGLVLAVLAVAGNQTWRHFQRLEQKSPEQIGRMNRWASVVQLNRDFPLLGTGMGTFRWAYFLHDQEANQWVTHAHNDVLETATDGGAVGALLFLGGCVFFFIAIVGRWRRRTRVSVRLLAAGGVASMAAAFFHSLFDFSLRIPTNALVLVLVMALTWSTVNYRKESKQPRSLRDGGSW